MTFFINKDVNEKLDYVFIRDIDDDIATVSYTQDNSGGLAIVSATKNTNVVTDTDGNTYPANRAIILWVEGGNVGTKETVVLTYTTAAGRRLDETVVFNMVQEA